MKNSTIKFVMKLERNRKEMEEERLNTQEKDFAIKYGVGTITVQKYMGPTPRKEFGRGAVQKVVLDKDIVNKLRLTHTEDEIRAFFKTSSENIKAQCGTRAENGIPQVYSQRKEVKENQMEGQRHSKKKKPVEERNLNQFTWKYPELSDYELSWKSEAIDLDRPHPALYEHKKCSSCVG